jgi:uncharacterized protein YcaQ
VSPDELAQRMVSWHGLAKPLGRGPGAIPALLARLRCIQLDPLEPLGSQADLVALARVDGLARGDVYRATLPGHGFEHYAKERCLLPASAFPHYRVRAVGDVGWRLTEQHRKLPAALLDEVEAEVRERGPSTPSRLSDRGRVTPVDWSGWKGTARATTMALEALSLRCRLVIAGRAGRDKVYDTPERALPAHHDLPPDGDFARWALVERAHAAGLLPARTGPQWGLLQHVRSTLPQTLLHEGSLVEVKVGARRWLAPPAFLTAPVDAPDDRMRILGPLDPLLWDRELVRALFGFDYVWEVYKPAAQRRWGWYVVPLLHRGRLVGRMEARFVDGAVRVDQLWPEPGATIDPSAFGDALERHAAALRAASAVPEQRSVFVEQLPDPV